MKREKSPWNWGNSVFPGRRRLHPGPCPCEPQAPPSASPGGTVTAHTPPTHEAEASSHLPRPRVPTHGAGQVRTDTKFKCHVPELAFRLKSRDVPVATGRLQSCDSDTGAGCLVNVRPRPCRPWELWAPRRPRARAGSRARPLSHWVLQVRPALQWPPSPPGIKCTSVCTDGHAERGQRGDFTLWRPERRTWTGLRKSSFS